MPKTSQIQSQPPQLTNYSKTVFAKEYKNFSNNSFVQFVIKPFIIDVLVNLSKEQKTNNRFNAITVDLDLSILSTR